MVIVYWPVGVLSPANPPLQPAITSATAASATTLSATAAKRGSGRRRNIATIIGIMIIKLSRAPTPATGHIGRAVDEGPAGVGPGG